MILQPHQPITLKGDRPSRELLEALQANGRDASEVSANVDALNGQMLSVIADLANKAPLNHTHLAVDITDSTAAGRAMLTAADAAAQTALLDVFTATEKGLVPAGSAAGFLRSDGVWSTGFEYGHLAADYTLTSTTAVQQLFNWSANGALTLAAGIYRFRCMIHLTDMSATSGNGTFHLLGAGTATVARVFYQAVGNDNITPLGAGARSGSGSVTQDSTPNVIGGGVGTGLLAAIDGIFDVTTAGTVIPSIALGTAAAAIVKAGSYFECQRVGATGVAASGGWS